MFNRGWVVAVVEIPLQTGLSNILLVVASHIYFMLENDRAGNSRKVVEDGFMCFSISSLHGFSCENNRA